MPPTWRGLPGAGRTRTHPPDAPSTSARSTIASPPASRPVPAPPGCDEYTAPRQGGTDETIRAVPPTSALGGRCFPHWPQNTHHANPFHSIHLAAGPGGGSHGNSPSRCPIHHRTAGWHRRNHPRRSTPPQGGARARGPHRLLSIPLGRPQVRNSPIHSSSPSALRALLT